MINDSYDLKMLNLCKLLKSPINEFALKISGIYLIFGLVLCIISNSILLLVFIRHKNLRTTPNLIIIAITLINLIGSIEFPFMIGNTFNSKWIWPDLICLITGFLHILIGSFQIYSITALSFLRFLVLRQANKSKFVSKKKIVQKAMLACFVLSMFWAICPLIGWSYYSVENHLLSCSIAHDENNLNIISYNFCFFLFAFLGPLCVTIYTNLKSIFIVMKLRKKEPSLKYLKLLRNDRRVTVNIIIYICKLFLHQLYLNLKLISIENIYSWFFNYTSSICLSSDFQCIQNIRHESNLYRIFVITDNFVVILPKHSSIYANKQKYSI